MIIVRDLDNRTRRIVTGSLDLAVKYAAAIIKAGGTPMAEVLK